MTIPTKKPDPKKRQQTMALGRYVDLIVIQGYSTARATETVAEEYGHDAASWCARACGDRQ